MYRSRLTNYGWLLCWPPDFNGVLKDVIIYGRVTNTKVLFKILPCFAVSFLSHRATVTLHVNLHCKVIWMLAFKSCHVLSLDPCTRILLWQGRVCVCARALKSVKTPYNGLQVYFYVHCNPYLVSCVQQLFIKLCCLSLIKWRLQETQKTYVRFPWAGIKVAIFSYIKRW